MRRLIINFIPPIIFNLYLSLRYNSRRITNKNINTLKNFNLKFKVLDFKLIDTNYKYNLQWGWWSRIFEYELVLQKLKDLNASNQSIIHNTCWGYQGCHILFKTELESRYSNVVNSDVQPSSISNTIVHDLRNSCPEDWNNKFDFVLNISTIEEIAYPHIRIFENLLKMVKIGGFLIVTFDLPGLQLDMFERLFGVSIQDTLNPVTGITSPYRMDEFHYLKVGYFVVQKT